MSLSDFRLPRALRRTVAAAAPVILPDDLGELGIADELLEHVELTLRSFATLPRLGLTSGMAAFEAGAAAFPGAWGRPFSLLPLEKRTAYFDSWWHSPVGPCRQFAKLFKALLAQAYWEHPTVKQRLEYHPDAYIAKVAKERLARWGVEISAHEADVLAPDPLVPASRLTGRRKGVA